MTELTPASIDSNAFNQLFTIKPIAHLQWMGETGLLDGFSRFSSFFVTCYKQHYITFRSLQTGKQLCALHGRIVYPAFGGSLGLRVRRAVRAPRALQQCQL